MNWRKKRLTGVDHAWLRMEDPTNLMMITGVMIFDEPLSYEALRKTVETRLLRFDRFRQVVREPKTPLGMHYWELDPHFDLRAHIHRIALPAPADQRVLEEVVSGLMSTPLDFTKPLWQFHLIENYKGGTVLLGRLHHIIGDGIALMRVLLSLTDERRNGLGEIADNQRSNGPAGLRRSIRSARKTVNNTREIMHEGMAVITNPERAWELARMGTRAAVSLGKLVLRWPDPPTPFKGPLGVIKKATWSQPVALEDVKAIGKVTGGTVNDVLLTAMTGALRRYMSSRGEPVDGVNFRATVPVNLRPLDGPLVLGNKFGLVFLSLPVGIADPVERLNELKRRMDGLKNSPEPLLVLGLLDFFGRGPVELEDLALTIFGQKATAVMTNVPGPREDIYLAGSHLDTIMFWVPQSARLGMGVSIISYAGRVWLGVAVDAGLVPDPERIIEGFNVEFEELMALVRTVQNNAAGAGLESTGPEAAAPVTATNGEEETSALPERCQARTQAGTQCRNRPQKGSIYCHLHQP